MRQLPLPAPAMPGATLADALQRRRSARGGDADSPLALAQLGTLLGLAVGKRRQDNGRTYPSGGGLYPVETYLFSTALEAEAPAVYHYDPSKHSLEVLAPLPIDFDMKSLAKHPPQLPLSTLIVFTSVWHRASAKYGDLAYQHALIESGHMSQNILLTACALGLEARPYAGFSDTLVAQYLDLDMELEQPVHSVTLCQPATHPTDAVIED